MALFMVVSIGPSAPAIELAILQKFPGNYYKIDVGKWLVSSGFQTSKEVSDSLGISTDNPLITTSGNGVVVAVKGYFGRGPTDLWEWFAAKFTA